MKTILITLILLIPLCLVAPGCTMTPKQAAYKSLAAVGHSEASAMSAAADLQVHGRLAPGAWPKIASAHDRFIISYGAAVRAARMDYSQPAGESIVALAQIVLDLVVKYTPPK